jgi:hypothetical protein
MIYLSTMLPNQYTMLININPQIRSCAGALTDLADSIDEMEQCEIWGRILNGK